MKNILRIKSKSNLRSLFGLFRGGGSVCWGHHDCCLDNSLLSLCFLRSSWGSIRGGGLHCHRVRVVINSNHLRELPHLLDRQHGHPPDIHVDLRLPPACILSFARPAHHINKSLLVLEVDLEQVELLLQLVDGQASLGSRIGGFGGVHPLGQLVNLALKLGPAFDKLVNSVHPFLCDVMGGVPSLSEGSDGDVRVVVVTHLLGNLGGAVKDLDSALQLVLEGLGVSQHGGGSLEAVWGAEASSDLLLCLAQAGIELLERSLILGEVPHVPAVLVKLLVDIVIQSGQVISELLEPLQELLGVAGDLLSLLGEHVHLLLLQGLAL